MSLVLAFSMLRFAKKSDGREPERIGIRYLATRLRSPEHREAVEVPRR